jgi:hypothetical protein
MADIKMRPNPGLTRPTTAEKATKNPAGKDPAALFGNKGMGENLPLNPALLATNSGNPNTQALFAQLLQERTAVPVAPTPNRTSPSPDRRTQERMLNRLEQASSSRAESHPSTSRPENQTREDEDSEERKSRSRSTVKAPTDLPLPMQQASTLTFASFDPGSAPIPMNETPSEEMAASQNLSEAAPTSQAPKMHSVQSARGPEQARASTELFAPPNLIRMGAEQAPPTDLTNRLTTPRLNENPSTQITFYRLTPELQKALSLSATATGWNQPLKEQSPSIGGEGSDLQDTSGANEIIDRMNQVDPSDLLAPSPAQRFAELARGFDQVDLTFIAATPDAYEHSTNEPTPDSLRSMWSSHKQINSEAAALPTVRAAAVAWDTRAALESRMQAPSSFLEADALETPLATGFDGEQLSTKSPVLDGGTLQPGRPLGTAVHVAASQNQERSNPMQTALLTDSARSGRDELGGIKGQRRSINEKGEMFFAQDHNGPGVSQDSLTGFDPSNSKPARLGTTPGTLTTKGAAVQGQISQSALKLSEQLAAQGTGTARLSIQDGGTGQVDIVVNLDRTRGLTIEIKAESEETRKRIEGQIDAIRENLESQNFRSVDVKLSGDGNAQARQDSNSSQQQSSHQPSNPHQHDQKGSFAGSDQGNNRERSDAERIIAQTGKSSSANEAGPATSGARAAYNTQGIQGVNDKGRISVRA